VTVFNLRGGNGAGKTTVGHWLIDTYQATPLYEPNLRSASVRKPMAWQLPGDLYVLGRYQAGGDGIGFDALGDMVTAFSRIGHVFFENVMVSGNLSTWVPKRRLIPDVDWVWMTLDTPAQLCLDRIQQRNGGKPVKEKAIVGHHDRIIQMHGELLEMGEHAVMIDHTRSIEHVHEVLIAGGWNDASGS